MGKRIFAIMLVVLILCSILVVPASAELLPGFFDPTSPLTGEMIQSVYYTFLNLLGLRGNITNNTIAYNRNSYYFTNEQLSEFILEQSVIDNWNRIKDYFVEDGTITYSDGRTVPRWKLEITAENENDVKLFAKDIQDKQMALYNYSANQNFVWTDISHVYGGYLSYAENFTGCMVYTYTNNSGRYTPVGINYGVQAGANSDLYYYYRPFGMDLYMGQSTNANALAPTILFSSEQDTFSFQNKPLYAYIQSTNFFGSRNQSLYYYVAFPFSVDTNSVSLSLSSRNTSINGSSAPYVYWNSVSLMTAQQYSDFMNDRSSNFTPNDITTNAVGTITQGQPGTATYNVSGGTFYIVAALYITSPNTSGHNILKLTNYYIENAFDIILDDNTKFGVWNVNGVPRGYGWSVDITDSGTGTVTTIPDAVSTVQDDVFDVGSVLYFPGAVTNVPEMVDILNGDMAITGEGAIADPDNPSNPQNESVSIDIVPPASLGLESIWHYVSDTALYCASFLSVLMGNIFTIIPTPIFNLAFAAVVLGILFGLYKRFIE